MQAALAKWEIQAIRWLSLIAMPGFMVSRGSELWMQVHFPSCLLATLKARSVSYDTPVVWRANADLPDALAEKIADDIKNGE